MADVAGIVVLRTAKRVAGANSCTVDATVPVTTTPVAVSVSGNSASVDAIVPVVID